MNYFGHAAIATLRDESSAFVLGSMLPDLFAMARLRLGPLDDEEVQRGVRFHIETDAVFHQTETFIALNHRALRALRARNVRRGPARACAHIGVEMLLDARLVQEPNLLEAYVNALSRGAKESAMWTGLIPAQAASLQKLCAHLSERGAKVHAPTKERFMERLGHTLRGRARLEPTDLELERIADYLSTDRHVEEQLPALLEELTRLTTKPS